MQRNQLATMLGRAPYTSNTYCPCVLYTLPPLDPASMHEHKHTHTSYLTGRSPQVHTNTPRCTRSVYLQTDSACSYLRLWRHGDLVRLARDKTVSTDLFTSLEFVSLLTLQLYPSPVYIYICKYKYNKLCPCHSLKLQIE